MRHGNEILQYSILKPIHLITEIKSASSLFSPFCIRMNSIRLLYGMKTQSALSKKFLPRSPRFLKNLPYTRTTAASLIICFLFPNCVGRLCSRDVELWRPISQDIPCAIAFTLSRRDWQTGKKINLTIRNLSAECEINTGMK